jgi:hypothetical protein
VHPVGFGFELHSLALLILFRRGIVVVAVGCEWSAVSILSLHCHVALKRPTLAFCEAMPGDVPAVFCHSGWGKEHGGDDV